MDQLKWFARNVVSHLPPNKAETTKNRCAKKNKSGRRYKAAGPKQATEMYFFYLDESGSRDLNTGTQGNPPHVYVLLAVGIYEGHWRSFEREVSQVKMQIASRLRREVALQFRWFSFPAGYPSG